MEMDPSAAAEAAKALALPSSYAKAVDAYRTAVGTAASVTAYVVLARGMARELLPHDLRRAALWAGSLIRARFETPPAERRTLVIKSAAAAALLYDDDGYGGVGGGRDVGLYDEVREYLATRIDPHSMRRLCLGGKNKRALSLEHGDSMTDVFEGVEFTWASVAGQSQSGNGSEYDHRHGSVGTTETLELSFDAEHTNMALGRYVPFITATVADARRRERALQIFINESSSWHGIKHHHPSTFDTLAMDLDLKRSIVDDLDRFLKRKEYYQRIGKAWKRGYLLYGPPGTGKSSLVADAAMANYLRFNLYDLDLSEVYHNTCLQRLINSMPNKSILVIEDIDCCFSTASRKEKNDSDHIRYRAGQNNSEVSCTYYLGSRNRDSRFMNTTELLTSSVRLICCSAQHNSVRSAQLHRRFVVDERRGAHHHLHYQLQGSPGPGAAPARPDGHARLHGLLLLGGLQDSGPELLRPRRPRAVPRDPRAARRGGGDTGRGVRDVAEERRGRRGSRGACRVPQREEAGDA
jgi:chaperone BCS1